MAGLSLYFGGEDKSLIRRHREDDPRIRFFDIFNAGVLGSGTLGEECPNGGIANDIFYCDLADFPF